MGALPARYCGWPISETLAVLAIHFASDLIRLRWNIIPEDQPGFGSIKPDNFLLAVCRDSAT
jgi:hypothetical protein